MLRLDHCVIQITYPSDAFASFTQHASQQGFPFNAKRGKGTKGFQTANLMVGEQYWEMVWLKRPDGGGWRPDWVERYQQGQRGIVCLMLLTDRLDELRAAWLKQGLQPSEPERISFSLLFLHKTLPWRNTYLGPIPGTDLHIGLQEMDSPQVLRQMQRTMVPNSRIHGINGFRQVTIRHAFTEEAWSFLQTAFPHATGDTHQWRVFLDSPIMLCFERTTSLTLFRANIFISPEKTPPAY